MPLSETTIAEELIQLTEHNFADFSSVIRTLFESLDAVHNEPDSFTNYQQYMEKVLCKIKADFNKLYQLINGMPLREMDKIIYPVCTLCRDHEKAGFVAEIKVCIQIKEELCSE